MAVYFVTGKLGGGKTLACIDRIRQKINDGLPVATNIDLKLENLTNPYSKNTKVTRISDKPSSGELYALGNANESYDERKNGAIVLDECATWFNSRNWQDKSRKAVNDWFIHSRKYGWDVFFIVQNLSLIDNQVKDGLLEHHVICRRWDRVPMPVIGKLTKLVGLPPLTFPRFHTASVFYGHGQGAVHVENWWYRGTDLFKAYDTKQVFSDDSDQLSTVLPPWYTYGRYNPRNTIIEQIKTYINKTFLNPTQKSAPYKKGVSSLKHQIIYQPSDIHFYS